MNKKQIYLNKIGKVLLTVTFFTLSIFLITQAEDYTNQPLIFTKELIEKEKSIQETHQNLELTSKLLFTQSGISSFYGSKFHKRKTSSGEIFHNDKFTGAHKTLPFGSIVRVINIRNGKTTLVLINDRGPFVKKRIIDLSHRASQKIESCGIPPVKIETITKTYELTYSLQNKFFAFSLLAEPAVVSLANLNILQEYDDFSKAMEILHQLQDENPLLTYSIVVSAEDYKKTYPKDKPKYYLAILLQETIFAMNLQ